MKRELAGFPWKGEPIGCFANRNIGPFEDGIEVVVVAVMVVGDRSEPSHRDQNGNVNKSLLMRRRRFRI